MAKTLPPQNGQQRYSDSLKRLRDGLDTANIPKRGRNPLVAKQTGYSLGMVARILSGHAELTARFVQAVCSGFGISREWVETGNGVILTKGSNYSIDDGVRKIENLAGSIDRIFFSVEERPDIVIPPQELIAIGIIFSKMAYRFDGSEPAIEAVQRAFDETKRIIEKPSNHRIGKEDPVQPGYYPVCI